MFSLLEPIVGIINSQLLMKSFFIIKHCYD